MELKDDTKTRGMESSRYNSFRTDGGESETSVNHITVEGELLEAPRYGRKTKYLPEYCQKLVEMARAGKTDDHFCVAFTITKTTFDNWVAKFDDFKAAKEIADAARKCYYHDGMHAMAINDPSAPRYNQPAFFKLYDQYAVEKTHREAKGTTINVNIDNTGKQQKELSPQERQEKLEAIKKKLLANQSKDEGEELLTAESLMESQDLSVQS